MLDFNAELRPNLAATLNMLYAEGEGGYFNPHK